MKILRTGALALTLLVSGQAYAADFGGPSAYCRVLDDAQTLVGYVDDRPMLRSEATQRYEHAIEVANAKTTIYRRGPLFIWAHEAKASCAKVIGYLRKPLKWWKLKDHVAVQKCDCFYSRMTHYLNASHRVY
ncbi:MAG: hypothetical protein ACR2PO_09490 [Methyloligellaceae bacterium]